MEAYYYPVTHTGTGDAIRPLLVADPAYKLTNWCMQPYPETRAITPKELRNKIKETFFGN